MKIIENGNFSSWFRVFLVLFGLLICAASYFLANGTPMVLLVLLGLTILAVGSLSEQANFFKIKPFGNNLKNIRKSYEKQDDDT